MKKPKIRTINELRQTKDSNYTHPECKSPKKEEGNSESLRLEAENFIHEKYFRLKTDLKDRDYKVVISALVDFKKQANKFMHD